MQNRLIQSESAYEWLSPLEQALGKKQFEQLVLDPNKQLYQLAKEKNLAQLKQIVLFNAEITNTQVRDLIKKENVQPFALHITKNGYSRLYELARLASSAGETFVIDFLLDHFPALNKKDVVLAYAENNDTISVNRLLERYQHDHILVQAAGWGYALNDNTQEIEKLNQHLSSDALIPVDKHFTEQIKSHPCFNITYSSPRISSTALKPKLINRVYHFFRKEKNISLAAFQKEFPANSLSFYDDYWVLACAAFYNHHLILNHIATHHFTNTALKMSLIDIFMENAIAGGSYEAACVLLNQYAHIGQSILTAAAQENVLLADKLLGHNKQATLLKPAKNIASNTRLLLDEAEIRRKLHETLSSVYIIIKNQIEIVEPIEEPTTDFHLQLKKNHDICNAIHHILRQGTEINVSLINSIMQEWLALFHHPAKHYSLHTLLNTPIHQLLPTFFKNAPGILTYANNTHNSFIYLTAILNAVPDALNFIELNTWMKNPAIIMAEPSNTLPLSFLESLLHDSACGRPLLLKHERLFDLAEPHEFFKEKFEPFEPNPDIKILRFYSVANACFQLSSETATLFVKKFGQHIKTYIDNPSLLLSLLNSDVGLAWLAQNIQALKNVPHNTFYFADIGGRLLDQPALAKLMVADKDILKALPDRYRNQVNAQINALKNKNEQTRENNKKIVEQQQEQIKQSSKKPTVTHDEASLIEAIENHGYLLNTDFKFEQKNGQCELIFSSTGDNPLGTLKNKFKETAKNITQEYKQLASNKIHRLTFRFSSKQLGNVISVFNSNDDLEKKASYKGCADKVSTEQASHIAPKAPNNVMNKEKWQQAIEQFFCESPHIKITEVKGKKLSFSITYAQTGKDWALKRNPQENPEPLLVTDNNVRQLFVASLTEQLQKTKLATVKCEKSGNQQKIIITPIANEPPDVSIIQAKNFDAILAHNDKWMPTIYDTLASQRVTIDPEEEDFFKEFHRLCQEKNIKASLVKKDGTVGALATGNKHTSNDRDYVTDCEDASLLTALGLTYNKRAKNLEGASLYKGKLKSGKSIDMVVTAYKGNQWAYVAAKSADITQCSLCIAMHNDTFFLLDPLKRGLADYKSKLIFPTVPEKLDEIIKKDPIRLIRAIKYQLKGNDIDPAYQQALLRWEAKATTFDIKQFSIKLMDEMKHPKTSDEMNQPNVSAWIQHLKDYGIIEKVYHQTNNDSNAAIIATIRGQMPSTYSITQHGTFRPAPKTKKTSTPAHNQATQPKL